LRHFSDPGGASLLSLQELERKLRDIQEKGGQQASAVSSGLLLAEDRKPSLLPSTTTAAAAVASHALQDQLPGPSILAAGGLPPINRIGSDEHHHSSGPPMPYGSQWAGPPPPRPGFDGLSYRPNGMASYPPPGAHHLPPLGDPHRYPATSSSNARWEQNPLATLADLTTTQTQMQHPAMRPPPLQNSLPSFNGGPHAGGGAYHPSGAVPSHLQQQSFQPYPYSPQLLPRPQPVPTQQSTYQAPTPQYTPPESDPSKSRSGHGSSSHGSASAKGSQRPSNASFGPSGPPQAPSPSSVDDSNEPPDPEQEAPRPVFEAERWERGGGDGKAADFVERAAARYTGRDLEMGKAAEPGHNIDQSVVEALAPSPSSSDMVRPPRRASSNLATG